jgi:hypothetical protein
MACLLAAGRSRKPRRKKKDLTHRGEGVAGVGDEHAGFADGAVANRDALDEPRRAHRRPGCSSSSFPGLLLLVVVMPGSACLVSVGLVVMGR